MPIKAASYRKTCYDASALLWELRLVTPSKKLLSENLDRLMTLMGISNSEMSRRVGVDRSMVGRWRDGITSPEVDKLWKIAEALNVPTSALFHDKADPRSAIDIHTMLDLISRTLKQEIDPNKENTKPQKR